MKLTWVIVLVVIPGLSHSQRHTIDSLVTILPSLKDSARVECLNKLALEYYKNALPETYINVQTDSARVYASQAYSEAKKIGYTRGIANALQNLGEIARDRNDFITSEKYYRQSIPLFETIHAEDRYSLANLRLGWSLFRQGKYAEARAAYEKAMRYYLVTKDGEKQSMLLRMISSTYSAAGYYDKAFENTAKAIRITYQISDERGIISSPENMGNLYSAAGEKETALQYFRTAAQNAKPINPVRYNYLLGVIARSQDKLDSAIYYYEKSYQCVARMTTDTMMRKRSRYFVNGLTGGVYLQQHKYDAAIEQFKAPLPFFEKGNDKGNIMWMLGSLAKCYLAKKAFATSFQYAKQLLATARETGARPAIRDAYQLYWQNYDGLGKTDSAYKYNLKYSALKDSILSDEYRRNMALAEMKSLDEQQKAKISLLQKDHQLDQQKLSLQQQKLKSESLLRYILMAMAGAFMLIGFFIFRYINLKRKNEQQQLKHELELQQLESRKAKLEFQQQATELEMQALRAQMNPHFIFNCLSSINRYILINKTAEASDYLTKFSRLIRMALQNAEKPFIALETDLEALRLYLDLERLRFKNAFNYSITFVNAIDANTVYIPPMLIQPFAENAIWHGLMHKKDIGSLDIQLCAENKTLTCMITDNGIGREMASGFKSRSAEKNKSMGVGITTGRLALLNKAAHKPAVFDIEDLVDNMGNACGTKVILSLPFKELTEVVL
ncbi:histidine kinase [Flavihumibacter petaseus]|uniref:Putative two-component histidine kinase n=1 Tax=Flavihumibacter petaseus NBRC 106054 TaxID=1220578 RepID=A0A0E9MZ19_9BACT|nr:histidine kinase [Flavihumibacter petaseus]GAO42355.1 putative two-component histidine kinase [Flavihumibacter petaseus NBRC 106054]